MFLVDMVVLDESLCEELKRKSKSNAKNSYLVYTSRDNFVFRCLHQKIAEYLIKLKQLSVDDKDSLQVSSCHPFYQEITSIFDCFVDQS